MKRLVLSGSALGFTVLSLLANGCGGEQMGTVTGKVLYDGKPLTRGTVIFLSEHKKRGMSGINADGSYSVRIVPGNAKITVTVPQAHGFAQGAGGTMDPAKFGAPGKAPKEEDPDKQQTQIPLQYGDPNKTPLSYTVTPGNQEKNIEIKKE